MKIYNVTDPEFKPYGKVITGLDVSSILKAMEETPLPEDVVYVPSVAALEETDCAKAIQNSLYGQMPIQIGYCNGNNHALNALEYHRDSEVNIAATDLILMLGRQQDIEEDFTYSTDKVELFQVPAGTVIEVYGTTLHYAPCNAGEGGFRCVVVLPKGTNTDLAEEPEAVAEDKLLFAVNKWLIGHAEGGLPEHAFLGLKGENLTI